MGGGQPRLSASPGCHELSIVLGIATKETDEAIVGQAFGVFPNPAVCVVFFTDTIPTAHCPAFSATFLSVIHPARNSKKLRRNVAVQAEGD